MHGGGEHVRRPLAVHRGLFIAIVHPGHQSAALLPVAPEPLQGLALAAHPGLLPGILSIALRARGATSLQVSARTASLALAALASCEGPALMSVHA